MHKKFFLITFFLITITIDSSISCPGSCDGEVSVSPTNGVAPILYSMTGYSTQTSQSWVGMCGDITFGTYTLDATDGNGCTASTNITLIEPLPFVYTVDSTPEYCGDSNGTASIAITQGGTLNYAYLWDDLSAQTTAIATNLITGLYEVRVTDANGCSATSFSIMFIADGISEINTLLHIFPNPTKDKLNIQYQGFNINSLVILNVSGDIVLQKNDIKSEVENSIQLNLSALSKGMYILQLISEEKIINYSVILQ